MTGRSTAIALAEMHRLAEETIPKVHRELERLGCQDAIMVTREDVSLRLTYHGRSVVLQPHILLTVLERMDSGRKPEQVWALLADRIRIHNNSITRKLVIMISLLLFAYFAVILLSQQ